MHQHQFFFNGLFCWFFLIYRFCCIVAIKHKSAYASFYISVVLRRNLGQSNLTYISRSLDMRSCILRSLLRTRRALQESFVRSDEVLTYSQLKSTRRFSSNHPRTECGTESDDGSKDADHNLAAAINTKYKFFDDKDADVILDVSEEQQKISLEALNVQQEVHDPYADINLNRKYEYWSKRVA